MKIIRGLALGVLGAGIIALGACTPAPTPPPDVIVYGDSLAVQAEAAAQFFAPHTTVVWRPVGGTALCDALGQATKDRALHPKRIVLAFTGNFGMCAVGAWNGGGITYLVDKYDQALRTFRVLYPTTPISILIPPAMHDTVGWFPFNGDPKLVAMYKSVGPTLGMSINTDADNWLTPGHVFRWTGPRFLFGPIVRLRSDGIHLTPDGQIWYGLALLAN